MDRGQTLGDTEFTDQAILERLTRDLEFRSVATGLLQRYGYLIPKPNSGSELTRGHDVLGSEDKLTFAGQAFQFGLPMSIREDSKHKYRELNAWRCSLNDCLEIWLVVISDQTKTPHRQQKFGNIHERKVFFVRSGMTEPRTLTNIRTGSGTFQESKEQELTLAGLLQESVRSSTVEFGELGDELRSGG